MASEEHKPKKLKDHHIYYIEEMLEGSRGEFITINQIKKRLLDYFEDLSTVSDKLLRDVI